MDVIKIVQSLTILELTDKKVLSEDDIRANYRKLVKIYHPDTADRRYKDGEKFRLIKEAHDYLLSDIAYVNFVIQRNFRDCTYAQFTAQTRTGHEEKSRVEEARRRAEPQRETAPFCYKCGEKTIQSTFYCRKCGARICTRG